MNQREYDLVVIGGGPGGYAAALRASQLGLSVAVVEKEKAGGACLHRGCVPSKAVARAAELIDCSEQLEQISTSTDSFAIDWSKTMAWQRGIVDRLYGNLLELLRQANVDLRPGTAYVTARHEVTVTRESGTELLTADRIVLATGSTPRTLDFPCDHRTIMTSDDVWKMESLPRSMLIVGGGPLGLQFASIFNSMGIDISVVEVASRLLTSHDERISDLYLRALGERGVRILCGATIESYEHDDHSVQVSVNVGGVSHTLAADKLLLAVGRAPNSNGLGIEEVGCRLNQGFIEVNDAYQTAVENIYAVGDVINTPQFAHIAFAEGRAAAEHMAGITPTLINYDNVPTCVFGNPEVASVGLTEQTAQSRGLDVKTAVFSFEGNAKALVLGSHGGLAKIVADQDGLILGVHLIGPRVTELISEAMAAASWEASADDVSALTHPHPTLSEIIGEAAMRLAGKPLHVASFRPRHVAV